MGGAGGQRPEEKQGEMTEQEALMMLRGQEEEEERMRAEMKAKRAHLLFFALIAVITTIAYSNSFHCEFVFDDYANIVNIKSIRVFQPDIPSIIKAATGGPNSKRWFPNLSFAFNYYLGGEDVWGYHLVNLIIHIGTTFVLYFLFSFTLRQIPGEKKAPSPEEIAFFAALLWAVHPIQTNGVTYLVQRMTSMCTFFIVLRCYAISMVDPQNKAISEKPFCMEPPFCLVSWQLPARKTQ